MFLVSVDSYKFANISFVLCVYILFYLFSLEVMYSVSFGFLFSTLFSSQSVSAEK